MLEEQTLEVNSQTRHETATKICRNIPDALANDTVCSEKIGKIPNPNFCTLGKNWKKFLIR